jgi:hypothetical protein
MKILVLTLAIIKCAHASLAFSSLITPGDNLLVTDTSTQIQWLVPTYTADHSYDDAFVQNLITTYGFRYATEPQVESMISSNFNSPPLSPGSVAGFNDVQQFFNVFGIAEHVSCGSPCPRTQGFTSTSPSAGLQYAVGMIQVGSVGYEIVDNAWAATSSDQQLGSFLIRSAVPEPGTFALFAIGCAGLLASRRFGKRR